MLNIMVVDDHALFRQGICCLLSNTKDFRVVARAGTGLEARENAFRHSPHIILMDISMPEQNGIEATRAIKLDHPEMRIIAVTMHSECRYLAEFFRAGGSGYVLKSATNEVLLESIREVSSGRIFLSHDLTGHVVDCLIRGNLLEDHSAYEVLTERERQVLQLLAEGADMRGIARKLNMSTKTAEKHRQNIKRKLSISDVPGLVRYAIKEGLTDLE